MRIRDKEEIAVKEKRVAAVAPNGVTILRILHEGEANGVQAGVELELA